MFSHPNEDPPPTTNDQPAQPAQHGISRDLFREPPSTPASRTWSEEAEERAVRTPTRGRRQPRN